MTRFACALTGLLLWFESLCATDPVLRGTAPLTIKRPVDELMVEGLNRYCLRELAAAREKREERWQRDFSSDPAYVKSIAGNRQRFRTLVGAVDPRLTSAASNPCRFELIATLDRSSIAAKTDQVTVHVVRWPVLDGVRGEGLLLVPHVVRAGAVALPDADWTPEMFCGLDEGLPAAAQFTRRLASAGCLVVIPTLISRSERLSGNPHVAYTNQPHREFLHRQAFQVGRHVIGYEVQKVLAAVDLLEQHARRLSQQAREFPIGVAGVGEGALIALYAAALDSRLRSSLICGYFQEREAVWQEPIYRNVWGLLTEFGDAELAGLVAPRRLVIEACAAVAVAGPPALKKERRASAAPGRIVHNRLSSVRAEFHRAAPTYRRLGKEGELVLVVNGKEGLEPPGSDEALLKFAAGLGIDNVVDVRPQAWKSIALPDAAAREKRQFDEVQTHVQSLLRLSSRTRDAKWRMDAASVQQWQQKRKELRDWVHEELIGRLPRDGRKPKARSRLVLDKKEYVGYEIVLDVADDVIAAGILLLPTDLRPGEKRPLVVCQHGLESTALDTITHEARPFAYYKAFAEVLVMRGFIVYVPQNPYRVGDRSRASSCGPVAFRATSRDLRRNRRGESKQPRR
ncbi:MAG: hypothetical protein FJ271_22675 [Planctomycetes bacterium]|nr:hypothetical protein [Planctomycetota bacterium]